MLKKPVKKMLIEPFLEQYNKTNGTKMSIFNVFNIAVAGEILPDTVEDILDYPTKTLAGPGDQTEVSFDVAQSAHVVVSYNTTFSEVDLSTNHLKDSLANAIIKPFLNHQNQVHGTKKSMSDLKGIVIDGTTPMETLKAVMAQKCYTIIRDPRQTEIRLLLA